MNKYLVAVCRHKEFPHILTVWAYSFEDAKEKCLEQEDVEGNYTNWNDYEDAMANVGTLYGDIYSADELLGEY